MNPIDNIGYIDQSSIKDIRQPLGTPNQEKGFSDMVKTAIKEVDDLHEKADVAVENLARGDVRDLHSTMIAMEKASISFELLMQVRNKVIDAYSEIKRMSI